MDVDRDVVPMTRREREAALQEAEGLLEEKMKRALRTQVDRSRALAEQISEIQKQRQQLGELVKKHKLNWASDDFELETLVNLGISSVFAKARVPDCRRVFVESALGFFVEMELEKAIEFLAEKEKHLDRKFAEQIKETTKIKANIHEMMYYISSLQQDLMAR
mmetsp:Transcript_14472/g.36213  ORF Transcript_14472/g.36213 Transcript_14472/m.36213 type:complete len:163 (+) Transcript_14472:897-1385(+)|eukprot:g10139.t1